MQPATLALPTANFALLIDGQVKTEFETREGALAGAKDLKRRFPMLQVRVYDPATKTTEEIGLAATGR